MRTLLLQLALAFPLAMVAAGSASRPVHPRRTTKVTSYL